MRETTADFWRRTAVRHYDALVAMREDLREYARTIERHALVHHEHAAKSHATVADLLESGAVLQAIWLSRECQKLAESRVRHYIGLDAPKATERFEGETVDG